MAAQKLRIGYQNVFESNPHVESSPFASGYPVENVTSWRYDQRVRAAWTKNILAALGLNWDFQAWTAGTSVAPDNWTKAGAGATIARSNNNFQVPPYSALLTRVGADCTLEIDLDAYAADYRWQQVTVGFTIYSTSVNTRVYITDDTGTTYQAHGGAGDEFVTVTRTLDGGATLRIGVQLQTSNHAAYIDGATLQLGDSADEMPDAPADFVLEVHGNDTPVPNWNFSAWAAGPEAAPDGWVLVNGAVRRSNTTVKVGSFAPQLVRAGTNCYLRYRFSPSQLAAAKGNTVGFGGHTWATVASRATWALVIVQRDGVAEVRTNAGTHSGGAAWEWDASASGVVPHDATAIELRAYVETGDTSAWFDAPAVRIGGAVTETPHAQAVTVFALAGHNLGTAGAEVTVIGSDDNFATSNTLVAAFTPTTNKALWKAITPGSHKSFRATFTGASRQVELGVPYLGPYLEMPEVLVGWSQHTRVVEADEPINDSGIPMESEAKRRPVPRTLSMQWVDEDWTSDELQDLLDHAGGAPLGTLRKRPFFILPEGGDHPDDVYLVWLSNQTVEPVWSFGRRTEQLSLALLAVGE